MITDSEKLALVWVGLTDIKQKINSEIIPVGFYLGIEDPDLMMALETLVEKIDSHFQKYRLVAEPVKYPSGLPLNKIAPPDKEQEK